MVDLRSVGGLLLAFFLVVNAAVEAGVMERGENRFHKKFTPHTDRTVFTSLMRNQGMKQHILRYILVTLPARRWTSPLELIGKMLAKSI
jgi:hypothetical protein